MKCTNCGFEQQAGKFCGQCGTPIAMTGDEQAANENVSQYSAEQAAGTEMVQRPVNHNEAMDKVKQATKTYGTYFVTHLKHPSNIFSNKEDTSKNGWISIGLVAILISFSAALLVYNLLRLAYGDYGSLFSDSLYMGPSFISLFGYALVFVLISIIIILFLMFVVNQFFGTAYSFKEMANVYGAHLVPAIVVTAIAFLLILLKSYTVGGYLLFISFGLVVTTFPVYLISSLLTRRSKSLDPLYGYLIYLVLIGIAFVIVAMILMDSTFGRLIDEIGYY